MMTSSCYDSFPDSFPVTQHHSGWLFFPQFTVENWLVLLLLAATSSFYLDLVGVYVSLMCISVYHVCTW